MKMKIVHFNHKIFYTNNQFHHIELTLETEDKKVITFDGIKAIKYTSPDNESFNTPAQVFFQLSLLIREGFYATLTTDEPTMFNLESVLTWPRGGDMHSITINHHVINERNG